MIGRNGTTHDVGDWKLPRWWTEGPWHRDGRLNHAEQVVFYNGAFVRNVLKHEGGITTLPGVE